MVGNFLLSSKGTRGFKQIILLLHSLVRIESNAMLGFLNFYVDTAINHSGGGNTPSFNLKITN